MNWDAIIAFGGVAFIGLVSFLGVWYSIEEKKKKDRANLIGPTVFLSGKAVRLSDELDSEFRKLVMAIAVHQAKLDGKEYTTDGKSKIPEEKLISEQDMQKAFLRAVKEVGEWDYACGACQNTPLQRMQRLIEKYQSETP